ncbi:shikimate dehydrogenase [Egicoccus sp. AB-alg2]|uniref:shikimate dehydrogenase family protein n=1 Tax=Egicoccus sp. AB-alg2 TaxID=3242693 RepID=UPI00359E873A
MSQSDRRQTFGFVGVTATRSSINRVFPRWADVLGLGEVVFDPIDLDVDVDSAAYREVVGRMAQDPGYRGALVTTHKVRLLEACRDLFDELDPYAELLGEVSCIASSDGRLRGSAKDPITSGQSLADFVPAGHFERTGGHVLCLGAGGAGLAITVHLLTGAPACGRPDRVVLVNRGEARLEECRRVLTQLDVLDRVDLVANSDVEVDDDLCAELPDGSLVVNATGMGKDRPGSPISDAAVFPRDGLVWELNYRGDLDFLHQARAQQQGRNLTVEDGWRYFVYGWSAVVADVFGLDLDAATLARLSDEAAVVRS